MGNELLMKPCVECKFRFDKQCREPRCLLASRVIKGKDKRGPRPEWCPLGERNVEDVV